MTELERTVRFYAAFDADDGARVTDLDWEAVTAALGEGTEHENQMPTGNGTLTVGKPSSAAGITLLNVSQVDLPKLYNSETGELRDLDDVMGDEPLDIAEVAYFLGFPGGVVGLLYNHRGPKARGLERYLEFILGWGIELRPIPRVGTLEAVQHAGEVKLFRVRLASAATPVLRGSSLAAMEDLAKALPGTDIEVIVRATGPARGELARNSFGVARSLLSSKRRHAIKTLRAELGESEDIKGDRALDLLEEYLVVEAIVTSEGGRNYIAEGAALDVIAQAYRDVGGIVGAGIEEM